MTTHVIPLNELFVQSIAQLGISGLATDDLRIAFLQATSPLCADVQRKIWEEVLFCTEPIAPKAPTKCSKICYKRSSISLQKKLFPTK
jgi:hypothetical protein